MIADLVKLDTLPSAATSGTLPAPSAPPTTGLFARLLESTTGQQAVIDAIPATGTGKNQPGKTPKGHPELPVVSAVSVNLPVIVQQTAPSSPAPVLPRESQPPVPTSAISNAARLDSPAEIGATSELATRLLTGGQSQPALHSGGSGITANMQQVATLSADRELSTSSTGESQVQQLARNTVSPSPEAAPAETSITPEASTPTAPAKQTESQEFEVSADEAVVPSQAQQALLPQLIPTPEPFDTVSGELSPAASAIPRLVANPKADAMKSNSNFGQSGRDDNPLPDLPAPASPRQLPEAIHSLPIRVDPPARPAIPSSPATAMRLVLAPQTASPARNQGKSLSLEGASLPLPPPQERPQADPGVPPVVPPMITPSSWTRDSTLQSHDSRISSSPARASLKTGDSVGTSPQAATQPSAATPHPVANPVQGAPAPGTASGAGDVSTENPTVVTQASVPPARASAGLDPGPSASESHTTPATNVTQPPQAPTVQLARMVNGTSQSEMHVGLQTQVFGNVEVHTVVRENQVGLAVGAEKGDLKMFLSPEVVGLQTTLHHQDLRFDNIRFLGEGSGTTAGFSSGSNSQSRFSDQRTVTTQQFSASLAEPENQAQLDFLFESRPGLNVHA